MIAQFKISLDFRVYVSLDVPLEPFFKEVNGYRIKVNPPRQSLLDEQASNFESDHSFHDRVEKLVQAPFPRLSNAVKIRDSDSYYANMLLIEIFGDDFDRNLSVPLATGDELTPDPLVSVAFSVANDLLSKLRILTRSEAISLVSERQNFWRVDFLADDGSTLPVEEGKFRRKFGGLIRVRAVAISPEIWSATKSLDNDLNNFNWDTLLLDAQRLLPEIGPSVAVANAALECLIPWVLDQLQRSVKDGKIIPELWNWIVDRDNWLKEPSVEEQFDILLKVLSGKSLKENSVLWQAFKDLRKARNSFSHEGKAVIGKQPVTLDKARELVLKAGEIIEWVEQLLPSGLQRPKVNGNAGMTIYHNTGFSPPSSPPEIGNTSIVAFGLVPGGNTNTTMESFVVDAAGPSSSEQTTTKSESNFGEWQD